MRRTRATSATRAALRRGEVLAAVAGGLSSVRDEQAMEYVGVGTVVTAYTENGSDGAVGKATSPEAWPSPPSAPRPTSPTPSAPRFFEVDSFQTLLPQAFFMLVAAGGILMTATDMNHGPHHGTPSLSEATS